MKSSIPNLFIVGVAKAGTTALAELLTQHPDIYFSEFKEPNYFSHKYLLENPVYYKELSIDKLQDYLDLFENKEQRYLGEASVSYFNYPESAEKIKQFNPDSKTILILRNPVRRALSHYLMDRRLGYVNFSLEEIIHHPEKHPLHYHQYINQSLYFDRLARFLDEFKDSLLVLKWTPNLELEMSRILSFLDLEEFNFQEEKSNRSFEANNAFMRALYKSSITRKTLSSISRSIGVSDFVQQKFFRKQSYKLNSETEIYLNSIFKKDCDKIESLTSIKLL